MQKILFISLLILSSTVHAQDNCNKYELKAGIGASFNKTQFVAKNNNKATSPNIMLGFNKYVTDKFNYGVEFNYITSWNPKKIESGTLYQVTLNSLSALGVVEYDFYSNTDLKIYGAAGIGATKNSTSDYIAIKNNSYTVLASKNHYNFAWKAGVGIKKEITEKISLDLGFQYLSLGQYKNKNGIFTSSNIFSAVNTTLNYKKTTAKQVLFSLRYALI
jgi:opacity protein-like surface antigen